MEKLKKERKETTISVLEICMTRITFVKTRVTSGNYELDENYKKGYLHALGRVLEFLDHLHETAQKG